MLQNPIKINLQAGNLYSTAQILCHLETITASLVFLYIFAKRYSKQLSRM